jgi:hypothetical protein
MAQKTIAILYFMCLILACACSSKGLVTSPSTDAGVNPPVTNHSIPVAVSDWSSDGIPLEGTGILGLFDVTVDVKSMSAELTPLRMSNTFDVFESMDITSFLTISPCVTCVKVNGIGINSDGDLVLVIALKHPIPMGDPSSAITASNRGDLMVYNVEGLIVTDGIMTISSLNQIAPVSRLKNADGYSSYLDDSLDVFRYTQSTVHPYILHFEDYSTGNYDPATYPQTGFPPPPEIPRGNLVMGQGSEFDPQEYIFNIEGSSKIQFMYAVQCTYGLASTEPSTRFSPESRVPQHNKKAASKVEVGIFTNGLTGNVTNSQAVLHVRVLDMNHGVQTGTELNQMKSSSNVESISIMIPNVTSSPFTALHPMSISGEPRNPDNPLTYEITVTNSGNARSGYYYGLCKVLDSYDPGQNILIKGADGIARVEPDQSPIDGLFTIPEFATYQVFGINVANDPDATLLYEPDPSRTSISISDPSVDYLVNPAGELDLGVCENISEHDLDGVYLFDEDQQVIRFDRNYINSFFQAPALLPSNDTGTHPNPDAPMPGFRIDVASNGYIVTSYYDTNETWDLSDFNPSFYDPLPEGDIWAHWEPRLPRPDDFPPYPHRLFLAQVCLDINPPPGEPLENPIAHEAWDESSFITVSTPAAGDPNGTLPYNQPENALSVMFRYTNPLFVNPNLGYASVYYGHYPPYFDEDTSTFYSLYSYAWEFFAISGDEIVGVDRSNKDWLFICASGQISQAAWSSGSSENLFLIDSNQPGSPGWMLDLKTALNFNAEVIDVECIPYDPNNPVIFDDGHGGRISQIAAIGAILCSNKHIYLIAFDDTPNDEAFLIYQDIDGSGAITGQPKHLDVGELTLDIHVTSTDQTTAYVTVFRLTAQ